MIQLLIIALVFGFGVALFHQLILNNGIELVMDSRPLPENIKEYTTTGGVTGVSLFGDNLLYGKFAEVDSNFPFKKLQVDDVIEIQFKDKFQVVHFGRIIEILDYDPLTFKTERIGMTRTSIEGVDYPITEEEYLGKIVKIFKDKDTALDYVEKTKPKLN